MILQVLRDERPGAKDRDAPKRSESQEMPVTGYYNIRLPRNGRPQNHVISGVIRNGVQCLLWNDDVLGLVQPFQDARQVRTGGD